MRKIGHKKIKNIQVKTLPDLKKTMALKKIIPKGWEQTQVCCMFKLFKRRKKLNYS